MADTKQSSTESNSPPSKQPSEHAEPKVKLEKLPNLQSPEVPSDTSVALPSKIPTGNSPDSSNIEHKIEVTVVSQAEINDGQQCSNCGTTKTPLWRRAPDGTLICNACGLYLRSNNANRPVNLKKMPTFISVETQAGSCAGDGQCNGTGGSAACKGCPAYNNRVVFMKKHEDQLQKTDVKPTSKACASATTKPAPDCPADDLAIACFNCSTTITPLWRRDDNGNTICNACGLYYKLHGFHRPVRMKKATIKRRKRMIDKEKSKDLTPEIKEEFESQSQSQTQTPTPVPAPASIVTSLQHSQTPISQVPSHLHTPVPQVQPPQMYQAQNFQSQNPPLQNHSLQNFQSQTQHLQNPQLPNQLPNQLHSQLHNQLQNPFIQNPIYSQGLAPHHFPPYNGSGRVPNGPGPLPGPPPPGFHSLPPPRPSSHPIPSHQPNLAGGLKLPSLQHSTARPAELPLISPSSRTSRDDSIARSSQSSPVLKQQLTPPQERKTVAVDFTSTFKSNKISIGGLLNK